MEGEAVRGCRNVIDERLNRDLAKQQVALEGITSTTAYSRFREDEIDAAILTAARA
jgi:hypothetical protein